MRRGVCSRKTSRSFERYDFESGMHRAEPAGHLITKIFENEALRFERHEIREPAGSML